MKRANSYLPFGPEQIAAMVAAASDQVDDPNSFYDPSDPLAFEAFWKNCIVVKGGGVQAVRAALAERESPGQPGLGAAPPTHFKAIRTATACS